MRNNIGEIIVGTIVLVIACLSLWYGYSLTDRSFNENGYTLHASFDHIDGISIGSDVRISGIKVGEVTELSLDNKNYLAIVGLSIRNGIEIPDDSSLISNSDGLLGKRYLKIVPGSGNALKPGENIRMTQGAVDPLHLISKFIFNNSTTSPTAPK